MEPAAKIATKPSVDTGGRSPGRIGASGRLSPWHALHRAIGNQSMLSLQREGVAQAKLTVSHPDDVYEQEADRVADEVMRMPEPAAAGDGTGARSGPPRLQRLCAECEEKVHRQMPDEEESLVQTAREDSGLEQAAADIAPYVGSLDGRGTRLAPAVRAFMEPRFGADFSAVRVHTGAEADRSAESVRARAYTVGPHIVFRAGQYDPDSPAGKHLLAHELTHVVQQGDHADLAAGCSTISPPSHAPAEGLVQRAPKEECGRDFLFQFDAEINDKPLVRGVPRVYYSQYPTNTDPKGKTVESIVAHTKLPAGQQSSNGFWRAVCHQPGGSQRRSYGSWTNTSRGKHHRQRPKKLLPRRSPPRPPMPAPKRRLR